jgi:hypothetical protein
MQDCELLNLGDRPEKLIITEIAVPPVTIRPSVFKSDRMRFVLGSLEAYVMWCFSIDTCHCNATNVLLLTAMKIVLRSY